MGTRPELSRVLHTIMGDKKVYFQPSGKTQLEYPCLIYKLDDVYIKHANNKPYISKKRYMITLIDKDPDSIYLKDLLSLPTAMFSRSYCIDNLNHFVVNIYY